MRILAQVLDGAYGKYAVGVRARLTRADDSGWAIVADAETDDGGRIEAWDDRFMERGLYRIIFDIDSYFAGLGAAAAYPEVAVIFRLQNETSAFQIQVTLAPYSYSTYFGTADAAFGASAG
jgi:5-hydroxyisourate hydrolase